MKTYVYVDAFNVYYRPHDPDQLMRQNMYLRALRTINPQQKPCRVLKQQATFYKTIRRTALQASQFPDELHDEQGLFHKPAKWNVQ